MPFTALILCLSANTGFCLTFMYRAFQNVNLNPGWNAAGGFEFTLIILCSVAFCKYFVVAYRTVRV